MKWKFSRSSGPGGQNVNKVNSKCELKIEWQQLQLFLGEELANALINDKVMYFTKEKDFIMKSEQFRTQELNKKQCIENFVDLINKTYTSTLMAEPSFDQKQRVEEL